MREGSSSWETEVLHEGKGLRGSEALLVFRLVAFPPLLPL